jgi:hypothetical protein
MKLFLSAVLLPGFCVAAILPDTIGLYHRGEATQPALADRAIWDEYGLKDFETVTYVNGASKFTATAYQLQDTTGSLAAFDWQRPPHSMPSSVAAMAVETPASLMLVHGNYLLDFSGYKPSQPELDDVAASLKQVDRTSLPTLPGHMPEIDRIPSSERYILGPASLQKFVPAIPPSVAAFHLSAEAQYSLFQSSKGETAVVIFDYPTPQIAMQRVVEFGKLPGAMVKRSGPLVAVALSPSDPDLAESLLSQVRYLADITLQEHIPTLKDNIGNLVINAFILIGILLAFITVAGISFGAWRALRWRGERNPDADTLITLHLQ